MLTEKCAIQIEIIIEEHFCCPFPNIPGSTDLDRTKNILIIMI